MLLCFFPPLHLVLSPGNPGPALRQLRTAVHTSFSTRKYSFAWWTEPMKTSVYMGDSDAFMERGGKGLEGTSESDRLSLSPRSQGILKRE